MQEKQQASSGFVLSVLPWIVAAGALLVYLVTLNHWVTLASLPFVAKVTGWDWVLPLQAPLFFLISYPIRWLPAGWQPVALNVFAAACSALTLALLARSVALLPHDRTHAQRQRERSEFSLLSIPSAWLPPVFASLVCGLQLTFWEHATAATNEALNLLIFAYVIRCLLEYRIGQNESWLSRLALVYALGVTNNWAMIGFVPCFLVALIWIKGTSFFQARFLARLLSCGVLGLLLYLVLPIAWALADTEGVGFWQALRAQLVNQKNFLLSPDLRNRALVLSLTSILPVLIMGIRWPSSFGDTSAAGAALTNLMFRVIHIVFLAACLWVAFDQKFSPRALGRGVPFLTFYYLGALGVGYFSGYVLLVFGESRTTKAWKRRSPPAQLASRAALAALWLALIAVPAGLAYKNFGVVWENRGAILKQFAESLAESLPPNRALVLSDDLRSLLLLEAHLTGSGASNQHVMLHSRSLRIPEYQRQLLQRHPQVWPDILRDEPQGEVIDDSTLAKLLVDLGRTNEIYYLHPSFGYYFESFYARPRGLIYQLHLYPTNTIAPPLLSAAEWEANRELWAKLDQPLQTVRASANRDSGDAKTLSIFYSRALNDRGVTLQKAKSLNEAGESFRLASALNTNNRPAALNLEYNQALKSGAPLPTASAQTPEDKFGLYRDWESMLADNGFFDHPEYTFQVGEIFFQQGLFRQAALQFLRVQDLEPTNTLAQLALARTYLKWRLPDKALEQIAEIRARNPAAVAQSATDMDLTLLEASAQFSRTNYTATQQILTQARAKYPDRINLLEALVVYHGQMNQITNALSAIDQILRLDPDNPSALMNQATLYFNQTNRTQALASLDRVLRNDSKNTKALLYKVFMYIETKDYPNAMKEVERVLELDPDNEEGLLYKGGIHIEAKEYDKAIPPLDRLLELAPDNWNALRNRAIAHLQRNKLGDAWRDYEHLQRQLPKYHVPYFGLAEIAYRRKDTGAAVRNYEHYLRFVPETRNSPEMAQEKKMVEDRLRELKAAGR